MSERQKQLEAIAIVARGLGELRDKVAFVGGATLVLYLDDPGVEEVRATMDVDCVIEVAELGGFAELEKQLRALGFTHATEEGAPICRWHFSGVVVDVMPTDQSVLGFSNRWYPQAMQQLRRERVAPDVEVWVFELPYYIASKLEAFNSRGRGDWLSSHDLEDVVAVLDGATAAEAELSRVVGPVSNYIRNEFRLISDHSDATEIILAHLSPDPTAYERAERILGMLQRLGGDPLRFNSDGYNPPGRESP